MLGWITKSARNKILPVAYQPVHLVDGLPDGARRVEGLASQRKDRDAGLGQPGDPSRPVEQLRTQLGFHEEEAVMAYPQGEQTVGREAIRKLWERALPHMPRFEPETSLPTLISGDLGLTSTPSKDGAGVRTQVVRRQPDGSWLRVIDQPELNLPGAAR